MPTPTQSASPSPEPHRFDVAVVGLGPAGRMLAHRAATAGARVLAVDPVPERPWTQTLAGWEEQLPEWVPAAARGARAHAPEIRADDRYPIAHDYVVLDNEALRAALPLDHVRVEARAVTDAELAGLPARVVVDARGSRPAPDRPDSTRPHANPYADERVPLQRAFGVRVSAAEAAPVLADAEAVLMDWRPCNGERRWGRITPTFLYVIPLPDGGYLLEETCLAGLPGPDHDSLRRRLRERLRHHGVRLSALETADRSIKAPDSGQGGVFEYVTIPMLQAPRRTAGPGADRVVRFGSAGAQHNPVTGYSVFASLGGVDRVVERLAGGAPMPSPRLTPLVRRVAQRAVLRLAPDQVMALFDAFGRLPADRQRAVFDPAAGAGEVLAAFAGQFWRMPPASKAALIAATMPG